MKRSELPKRNRVSYAGKLLSHHCINQLHFRLNIYILSLVINFNFIFQSVLFKLKNYSIPVQHKRTFLNSNST